MSGGQRFYEDREAEEILRRALEQPDASSAPLDRSRLLAMASELGISEEAVNRAEAQLASEREATAAAKQTELDRIEFKRHRRRSFWNDVSSYISVNAFLIAIWWFTGHGYFWPGWVLAGWGIGVLSDFISAFLGFSERDFERWKRKRNRKPDVSPDVQQNIDRFLDDLLSEPAVMRRDEKLMQVKEVREQFKLGLKESKDAVDDYHRRHGQ